MDTLNPVAGAGQRNGHPDWPGETLEPAAPLKQDQTRTENPNGFVSIARAGLLGAAPLAPLGAAAIALALYVHPLDFLWTPPSLVAGVIDLVLAWCLVAAAYAALGFTDVRRANTTTYCELQNTLTELEAMAEDVELELEHPGGSRRARACK